MNPIRQVLAYKLRFQEQHVRIGYSRTPLVEPGVDLRGAAAVAILSAAVGMHAYVHELDSAYELRALSADWVKGKIVLVLQPAGRADCLARELRSMQLRLGDAQPLWLQAEALLPALTLELNSALERRAHCA